MPSSSSKYDIRLMHQDDYDQVFSLLTNSFFLDEPITQCLQITETSEFAKNIINGCLRDQCSFVAVDTQTNQIVAMNLNDITHRNMKHEQVDYDEKILFINQFMNHIHEKSNIFKHLNADKLLHIYIISVDKIARGHGLASHLISKSIEYAKELKLEGAYAEATSLYSLNCFKQQQFQILDELIYVDYDSKRLAKLKGPHYDRCYLVSRKFYLCNI
jgi:ribosomal protein S18 acetylase RimI-like enzyme